MMGRSQWHTLRPLGQPDFGFVLTGLTLALLGLLMVASSSIEVASDRHGSPFSFAIKHGIFLVIALGAGAITFMVPTKWWYRSATLFLVFSLVLLALVLIPGIGLEVKGARRWLDLGVINLQPSEVAKFTMMLYLAAYLVRRLEEVRTQFMGFLKPMAVVGLIAALLLAEPDFGTLMLIVFAVMGVLLLAGAPFNQYLMIGAAVVVGLVLLVADRRRA